MWTTGDTLDHNLREVNKALVPDIEKPCLDTQSKLVVLSQMREPSCVIGNPTF